MRVVTAQEPIALEELRLMAAGRFGDLVKGVADLGRSRGVDDPAVRERITSLVDRLVQR
jgi:hypothetical protein